MILFDSNSKKSVQGEVNYNEVERTLDFIPKANSDITIIINYINIGFDSDTMRANQVWGFSPKESWKEKALDIPTNIHDGELILQGEYDSGSWRIDKDEIWQTYYDVEKKWTCIGNPMIEKTSVCIEMLENVIAVLNESGQLQSLWVRPNFI
jgi:hypothetical protein